MTKDELIGKLNQDLADELGAMIQYILYAARATGPYRPQLSQFFLAEVADEQLHAQFLANKIVSLGGKPTAVPREVALPDGNRAMLEAVVEAEAHAMRGYTEAGAGGRGLRRQGPRGSARRLHPRREHPPGGDRAHPPRLAAVGAAAPVAEAAPVARGPAIVACRSPPRRSP